MYMHVENEANAGQNGIRPSGLSRQDGNAHLAELDRIILGRLIHTLFQPVFDLRTGRIFGYEALSRGPDASPLQMPELLFDTARRSNRLFVLEHLCREVAIQSFIRLGLEERLFLNVDPSVLMDPAFREGVTMKALQLQGLPEDRVVIELTEQTPVAGKLDTLKQAVAHYRTKGFTIALDDLSAGYSNLQLMAELRPEFIKLDKYFTQKLPSDGMAREFVRTIGHLAKHVNCFIIAEGIENSEILREVHKLGLHLGQGYLLGRPTARPEPEPAMALQEAMGHLQPSPGHRYYCSGMSSLIRRLPCVGPQDASDNILDMFQQDSRLLAIPVVEGARVIGIVLREEIQKNFARRFGRELHGHKPIRHLMLETPLVVHAGMSVDELSGLVTNRPFDQLYTPVIVEDEDGYSGMVFVHELLEHITQSRIELAINANPLTRLPGNLAIEREITHRLNSAQPFALCYIDLDNFKAFNDCYGYKRGDAMLELFAELIKQTVSQQDFAGHIGGDDFILILQQSEAWERMLHALMESFSNRSRELYDPADLERGGITSKSRTGELREFPLASLSIGAVLCPPESFPSHLAASEMASELKCKAKRTVGNCLEVNRRSLGDGRVPAAS